MTHTLIRRALIAVADLAFALYATAVWWARHRAPAGRWAHRRRGDY